MQQRHATPLAADPGCSNPTCPDQRITVIGAGAWGTALAISAARAGRSVRLWARSPALARAMTEQRINERYLPHVPFPPGLSAHADFDSALRHAQLVLLVVPSQAVRSICRAMAPALPPGVPVVVCAKGIEHHSGLLMHEVLADCLPGHPPALLSGPSFAEEVGAGMPTAVTVASADADEARHDSVAARVALALGTRVFRPYVSDDLVGVAVGGAVKNVLAIASGMATGLGFGANTRAAVITRGLEEVKRLSRALGGRDDTLSGLSGMGDLSLTCSSEQSRNMRFGIGLGSGLAKGNQRLELVEGADNVASVTELARRLGVEMPLCEAVRSVVMDGAPVTAAIEALMARPLRAEPDHVDVVLPHACAPVSATMAVAAAADAPPAPRTTHAGAFL